MTIIPKGTKTIAFNNALQLADKIKAKNDEIELKKQIFEHSQAQLYREMNELKQEIKINCELFEHGWFYVGTSSTDCDCVQSYDVRKFQSLKSFRKYCEGVYNWAEGPTSISIISKKEYDEERHHPTRSRDRIMEAYENGHGSSVLV